MLKTLAPTISAGHEIGRALHALELQPQDAPERANGQRLGKARDPFEQRVAAADDCQQQQVDRVGLADDDFGQLASRLAGRPFECAHLCCRPFRTASMRAAIP